MNNAPVTTLLVEPAVPDVSADFVCILAAELSAGRVDLPSFPEIAMRVRRVLSDPRSSIGQVVRVIGSEPALAARLMRIANAASLNRSGRPIVELRTAINRIGYNMVRSVAISFAMAQMRNVNKLAGLESYLHDLWLQSTLVAAFAFVLARNCSKINPDEAMLAGVMHGIGKLYVLTRATHYPDLFANRAVLEEVVSDWHAPIGKAILENWEFPEEMTAAVGGQENYSRDEVGPADLRDVLSIALLMARDSGDLNALKLRFQEIPAARRLGLDMEKIELVKQQCATEVQALSSALGD